MRNFDQIERKSAEWLIREDRGLDLRERAAFESWLSCDLAHRVSYLRLKAAWRTADQLSTCYASMPSPRPSFLYRFSAITPGVIRWAALAAVLLFMIGLIGTWVLRPQDQTIMTVARQHHSFVLSDGSEIGLSGNTSLKTIQTESGHAVIVNHGLAHFDVTHDKSHPFIVYVGDHEVTGQGVKVSVSHSEDGIEVVVEKGRAHAGTLDNVVTAPVVMD